MRPNRSDRLADYAHGGSHLLGHGSRTYRPGDQRVRHLGGWVGPNVSSPPYASIARQFRSAKFAHNSCDTVPEAIVGSKPAPHVFR